VNFLALKWVSLQKNWVILRWSKPIDLDSSPQKNVLEGNQKEKGQMVRLKREEKNKYNA